MDTAIERIHAKIADLEAKIIDLRIAEREIQALDKVTVRQTKAAPSPASKGKQKPGRKPKALKPQSIKPQTSEATEPRQTMGAAVTEVLDQHGALSATEISEHIKATGRDINNRAVSFTLQGLKKRGLAKNTDGKWSAGKARGRRARSASSVSPIQSEAAE
jgi:hypothetical protein